MRARARAHARTHTHTKTHTHTNTASSGKMTRNYSCVALSHSQGVSYPSRLYCSSLIKFWPDFGLGWAIVNQASLPKWLFFLFVREFASESFQTRRVDMLVWALYFRSSIINLDKSTEWPTIPACPSLMCVFFSNKGDTEGTNSSKILCSMFVYAMFDVNLCQDCFCGLWIICGLMTCVQSK